jgi:hypothetical protein
MKKEGKRTCPKEGRGRIQCTFCKGKGYYSVFKEINFKDIKDIKPFKQDRS